MGTSAGGGGTSVAANRRVADGGRVDTGGGPSAGSGENDNSNFKSMIEVLHWKGETISS